MNSKVEWCMEWGSTALLLVGVAFTSFNVFPLNLWVCLAANAGWTVMGIIWRKWSLLIVQAVVSAIYVVGLIKYHYT